LGGGLRVPPRPFDGLLEPFSGDASFSNDDAVSQHDRDSPVIEAEEFVVSVDIRELWIDSEIAEEGQGLVAEVAALPGDQDDLHEAEPSAAAG
jgi:hypothetical protein